MTTNITALGADQYLATDAAAAAEWAEQIRSGIRSDWDVEVAHAPADIEEVGEGVYHRPERLVVRASGDFAQGSYPVRDQGRASFRAVIWIGEKPLFVRS